jgi:hypothetical protein
MPHLPGRCESTLITCTFLQIYVRPLPVQIFGSCAQAAGVLPLAAQMLLRSELHAYSRHMKLKYNMSQQWLHGASTCPVCRKRVKVTRCPRYQHGLDQGPTPSGSGVRERDDDDDAPHESVPQGFGSDTPPWRLWE